MPSSVDHVLTVVRRQIFSGARAAGSRISEVALARDLGVSRTPARTALAALEAEGLIEKREGRGFTVTSTTSADIAKAIEVRAVLEGLAVRTLAETGMTPTTADTLTRAIDATARLLDADAPERDAFGIYQDANRIFHRTIMRDCGNDLIGRAFDRISQLPMAALGTLAISKMNFRRERLRLTVGHSQHVILFDAIQKRDGARAEAMMREHSKAILNYEDIFVRGAETPAPQGELA